MARQPANASAGSAGAVAQLGERRNRTAEVRGSNPLGSTNKTLVGVRYRSKNSINGCLLGTNSCVRVRHPSLQYSRKTLVEP